MKNYSKINQSYFKKPLLFESRISSQEKKRIINEANQVLKHFFIILSRSIKFGKKINWHTNFSDKSWPKESYAEFRARNYDFDSKRYLGDIKLPWELNKHLYLQDLAKAYLITKNEKYAQEFVEEIEDWLKENPFMVGVNWTEGLIAAHRAISWIIALGGFIGSSKITSQFLKDLHQSLFQHALFIEKTYEFCQRASNHLLGELCAQIVISTIFPEFDGSKKRLKEAIGNFRKELQLQVYRDGVDYEMSLSYQRIILEFLYLPLILEKRNLVKLPREIIKTAEKMTEFMMHMTQPNGLLQPISDADGARVFVLGQDINDFRPHLALAAWLFDRKDFKYVSEGKIDPIAWFLSKDELSTFDQIKAIPPKQVSMAFEEGGYWTSRQNWVKDSSWLFFDCGYMGMGKWNKEIPVGVHGHSDTLNFGLSLGEEASLTDNGSYSYTTERPFHQYFRSSLAHNVALVDGQDQNKIINKPWLACQYALPQNSRSIFSKELTYLRGEHTGYLRLPQPIIYRREILFFRKENFLILKDTFLGKGEHQIEERFHLAPGLKIKKIYNGWEAIARKASLKISSQTPTDISFSKGQTYPVEGWFAPNFGTKKESYVLKFSYKIQASQSIYFLLSWQKRPIVQVQEIPEIFEKNLAKIQKPKIVMLVTNNLTADPRVQKEAESTSRVGFEIEVLAFSPENNDHSFKHKDYLVYHLIYEQPQVVYRIRNWFGRKVMKIYFSSKFFSQFFSFFGALKNFLRSKTLNLIDNDINQPIQTATKSPAPLVKTVPLAKRGFIKTFFLAIHYFYVLNRKLTQAGIEAEPTIVHANDLDTLLAGWLIKRKTGAKLIYDSHELWTKQGIPIPPLFIRLMVFLEKYLLGKVDALISVNESIVTELEKMHHRNLKIPKVAVYNTPKMTKFANVRKSAKEIAIIYQGRFAPDRGLENLVLASQYFVPNIKLYFRCTGEKDIEEKIKDMVKKNKLENIEFIKPVAMNNLVKSCRFADIGIIPYLGTNRNNQLATPNKLFEYSMAGLAICASNLPEIAKFVKMWDNGLLFNPKDPKSIARAINLIVRNREILLKMKKNSLKAAKEYNWENQAKKLNQLYADLIKKEDREQMANS